MLSLWDSSGSAGMLSLWDNGPVGSSPTSLQYRHLIQTTVTNTVGTLESVGSGAGEVAQLVKCLPCEHKDPSLDL